MLGISRIRPNVVAVVFQTSSRVLARSVHPPIADMRRLQRYVGFVPKSGAASLGRVLN